MDKLEACFQLAQGNLSEKDVRDLPVSFIRSQDGLAIYDEEKGGNGLILTAWQGWKVFSPKVFREVIDYGSAVINNTIEEPSKSLKMRRMKLNLAEKDVVDQELSVSDIRDLENRDCANPMKKLVYYAQKLGLDENSLSWKEITKEELSLAARFKESIEHHVSFTPSLLLKLNEIMWIAQKTYELADGLGIIDQKFSGFEKDNRYGDKDYPAYQIGYDLANKTRRNLGLNNGPISNLRDLCRKLGVIYICMDLPKEIAGLTLASGSIRCITTNCVGDNQNEWVRRITIAHELGHLLWDPDEKLRNVKVDDYSDTEIQQETPSQEKDFVEQRARAFAVELLLPTRSGDVPRCDSDDKKLLSRYLREIMEKYGISLTSAFYHLKNQNFISGSFRSIDSINPEPTAEWKGKESFDVDYFPIENVPPQRRGFFSYCVARATKERLITSKSGANYLQCDEKTFLEQIEAILEIGNPND